MSSSPDELRRRHYERELSGQFGTAIQTLHFQNADALDQQRFEASAVHSPVRARYTDRVEAALQAERSQGRNHSREALFKYLYGEDMEKRANASALLLLQRRAGAARVAGQTVRPAGTRSDSVPGLAPGARLGRTRRQRFSTRSRQAGADARPGNRRGPSPSSWGLK